MLFLLPFSNRSLKYFPPDFVMKDPAGNLVHKARSEGRPCTLILFHVDGMDDALDSLATEQLVEIQSFMQTTIEDHLSVCFFDSEIIAARQMDVTDFCVFVEAGSDQSLDLHYKALKVKEELNKHILSAASMQQYGDLQIELGFYCLDKKTKDTQAALRIAHHYARAIATKNLPVNFSYTRNQLNDILLNNDITVLAQPIMSLQSGEIFGWEILTRGPHNSPFHEPMDLFEFAYQANLLLEMELLVYRKALGEIASRGIKEQVFINITSLSLNQPVFLQKLLKFLEMYPSIQPGQIVFEITERHSIRDYSQMAKVLCRYRTYGFRFAVDDAGTGYSTLQCISELVPDIIKIDKSLIQNIDQVAIKQSLLKALLGVAKYMNCQVIAEGVEREEEIDVLFKHDVEMGQGYYFARPEPLLFDHDRMHFEELKHKILLRFGVNKALV